ncbi:MAG TPA: GAF domain-containing protein [Elusimicrobiota bacterium]|nr:GAF domain-containing protein [Elusimicrobiota bacterium]
MKLGIFHFELLYNVLQDMHFLYNEEEMATLVLARIVEALNAEAGTVFRFEPDGSLYPLASYGTPVDQLRKQTFKTGVGVVGWVSQYMQPVKVDKPEADPRFYGSVDNTSGFKTRSIIAAPIIVRNQPIGIIEFLNRKDGPFVIQDLELISMIGRQVGIAMINSRVIQERDNLLAFEEAVVGSLTAGLLVVDSQGKIIKMNNRAVEILSLKTQKTMGEKVGELLSFCPPIVKAIEVTSSSKQPRTRQETIVQINGNEMVIGYSVIPVIGKAGENLGVALLFQDITKNVTAKQ